MLRPLLLAAAAIAAGTVALGAAWAAGPIPVPAWNVDPGASRLGFSSAMNGQAFSGAFKRWDAQIAFDPANLPASSVVVTIDIASADAGDATRNEALPTGDWFAAKQFPRATFKSRRIVAAGPGRYVAEGDLTLRNATRPASLPFTLNIAGDTAKVNGGLDLDRSQFGVGQGQWKGGEAVSLKVHVDVNVTARRRK